MTALLPLYILCTVFGGAFLAWTYTKPGKKWLDKQ